MQARREKSELILAFDSAEAEALRRALAEIIDHYRMQPGALDPKAAAAWYSRRGCVSAKMSAEDTREWIEHLHVIKGARLPRLEAWSAQLAEMGAGAPARLRVKLADAPDLMIALNDHRLLAAARHDIGEREMDINSIEELMQLGSARFHALHEIQLLAWIIEVIVQALQAPAGE